MKLVFMGTPAFAVTALEALLAAGHDVVAVYSQPPQRAGRGKQPRMTPVAAYAKQHNLPLLTPHSLREENIARHGAEVAVVVAYGLLLPQQVLDAFPHGCLNIHASLLPRWRGAAPIQRAIEAGDTQSGITIMQMERGLDTGPMLYQEQVPIIAGITTTGDLHDRLATCGALMIVDVLSQLDKWIPQAQNDDDATYAPKIDKAESLIDWSLDAPKVANTINAFSPFPGAWFSLAGERIKVLQARAFSGSGIPGTVTETIPLSVACGQGLVELVKLQRAGKKPMVAGECLRGWPALAAGVRLL